MKKKTVIYYIVGVTALLILVLSGFFAWHHSAFSLDDAFISYRYADNLIHGDGLVFNTGERVEGYTNFLWVLVAAAALKLHLDPFRVTRALGVASYLLTIASVELFLLLNISKNCLRELLILPLLAILILPEGPASIAGSGLETSFVALLIVLIGLTQHVWTPKSPLGKVCVAVIPLVACLTRLDATLFVASSALTITVDTLNRTGQWRYTFRKVTQRFIITFVGLTIYLLWKKIYYHEIFPNPYYAKEADQWNILIGWTYLKTYAQGSPHVLLLLPFVLSAPFIYWPTQLRGFTFFSLLSLFLYGAYITKVGGDFMHYRLMFEIYPIIVCLGAVGLLDWMKRLWIPSFMVVMLVIMLSTTIPLLEQKFGMQSLLEMDKYAREGTLVGQRLGIALPKNTIVSTTLAGTISYYSKLPIIDQWGLNDRTVSHQPNHPIITRGHVKFASIDYLQSRGVNLYMAHPQICSCSNPCIENLPNIFIRLRDDECVRTWYLVQKPELTTYFCSHPDDFLLHNVSCPVP